MGLFEDLWRDADRLRMMGARLSNLMFDPAPWVVGTYRVAHAIRNLPRWARTPALLLHRPFEALVSAASGTALSAAAPIGGGLHLSHAIGIVVSDQARIGRDCELAQGTTIGVGGRGDKRGAPYIGDRVYIGPGAKIFGPIRIGNDVAIGANAVVCQDVPDGAVVAGVPARIISMNGSRDFVVPGRQPPSLGSFLRGIARKVAPQPLRPLLKAP